MSKKWKWVPKRDLKPKKLRQIWVVKKQSGFMESSPDHTSSQKHFETCSSSSSSLFQPLKVSGTNPLLHYVREDEIDEVDMQSPKALLFFEDFYSRIRTPMLTYEPILDTCLKVVWRWFASECFVFYQNMFLGSNTYVLKPFGMSQHWTIPSNEKSWNLDFPPNSTFCFENKKSSAMLHTCLEVNNSANTKHLVLDRDVLTVVSDCLADVQHVNMSLTASSSTTAGASVLPSTATKKMKKVDTPLVVSSVRRGLRSDKEGYIPMELPSGPSKRKKSSVKLAPTPEVLQLNAMQKMGVEMCGIDPEDLSEEKLLQARPA
jgi:hypothetical protein